VIQSLVVDLDGTLLHPEPESIAVPGRSGYSYLSGVVATKLAELSRRYHLIIATGRNQWSVQQLLRQLLGIRCAGFVLENGLVCRTDLASAVESNPIWTEVAAALPHWERLANYEQCFGAIVPEADLECAAAKLLQVLENLGVTDGYVYAERHKIFASLEMPNKLAGLRRLEARPHIVFGNDWNDLDLLRVGMHVATLADASDEAKAVVQERGGYCSPWRSHRGVIDVLSWADEL
jgi:hydroxymethylpyrimidine pyrophosphatase-like HAD family hydrolase